MDAAGAFPHIAATLKGGIVLAIVLHALAFLPQRRAGWYHPGFLNVSAAGLVLAVAHGAVVALAGAELPPLDIERRGVVAGWCLAGAVLLNVLLAAHNLLAVHALLRLHRRSALVAHALRPAVQPAAWTSAALALAAYAAVHGWL